LLRIAFGSHNLTISWSGNRVEFVIVTFIDPANTDS
jgi:hypothetical protein